MKFQKRSRRILVTGGAGFIGSAFIRYGLQQHSNCEKIVNVDLLTYAANLDSIKEVAEDPRYIFIQADICDEDKIEKICIEHEIDSIVHFAAESHVDRSIVSPRAFFETNVRGSFLLLEVLRRLPHIHFHHVSTDEVYGSLDKKGCFNENSPYAPNSPYSASKAASDHFVRAYTNTYNLSTTLSHATNNFGPFQHEEKFLPRMIRCCLEDVPLPIYGNGMNVRDWLYVDDHVEAIFAILENAPSGSVYGVSGNNEMKNIEILSCLIEELSELLGKEGGYFKNKITYVADRPGHDFRYAIDSSKIQRELNWKPRHSMRHGLRKTVEWYLRNLSYA